MTHHQHPNVELLRRGYDAFAARDMQALDDLLADDVVWHVPGNNPMSGDYEGKEQVFGFFGRQAQELGGSLRLEIHDVLANNDHGVVLLRVSAERAGKTLEQNAVHILHLSGGKATEFWGFPEDTAAVDDFWS